MNEWTEWATVNPANGHPIVWDAEWKARKAGAATGHKVVKREVRATDWADA